MHAHEVLSGLSALSLSFSFSLFLAHSFFLIALKKSVFFLSVPVAQLVKACVAEQKVVGSNLAKSLF